VLVRRGGQTPLGLAERLEKAGVPIVGTSPKAIDLAEDRGAFGEVLTNAGLPPPAFGSGPAAPPQTAVTRCWCGRRMCWAAAAWRSSTTTTPWRATSPAPPSCRPSI